MPRLDGKEAVFIDREAVSEQEHEEKKIERLNTFLVKDHKNRERPTKETKGQQFTTNFTTEKSNMKIEFETFVDNSFPTQDFSEFVDFQQF